MVLRPLVKTLSKGDARGRLAALRSSRKALYVAVVGAALRTGILEELLLPATVAELATRRAWVDQSLVTSALRSFAAHGLLEERNGRWCTSRRGRRILDDHLVRAVYEAFAAYHTGLYRDLEHELSTGGLRHDIEVDGELIARLSQFMDEFVFAELDRLVTERAPRRLLDVGCGAAAHLRHVLHTVPDASAVGVEADPAAVRLARQAVTRDALDHRAQIVESGVSSFLDRRPDESFDFILVANVVYYVPLVDRVGLLQRLADRLEGGGRMIVISTMLTDDPFSRHFDLLLRAQAGRLELPDVDDLSAQLTAAGLTTETPRRIAPGEPLMAVVAHRP